MDRIASYVDPDILNNIATNAGIDPKYLTATGKYAGFNPSKKSLWITFAAVAVFSAVVGGVAFHIQNKNKEKKQL